MSDEHGDPQSLPDAAVPVWRAYRAMQASKSAHFAYLENLELKYRHGGRRTLAEQAHLANLLENHDRRVGEFTALMKKLNRTSPEARAALVELLKDDAAPGADTVH